MAGESYVDHEVLKAFAKNKVNVPKEEAKERRRQVNYLRERLEDYIADHPDFDLVKLRASGSTAKHTAIRRRRGTGSDADVAAYLRVGDPTSTSRRYWPGWRSAAKRSTARRRLQRTSSPPTTRSASLCGAPA
jgi:hypothetical protein